MTKRYEWGLFLLRIVIGIGFTTHGVVKFKGGIENISRWFDSLGLPGILAYGVALLEVLGGIALIAGLATRIVSLLFAVVMIVALWKVKLKNGYLASELEITYFTAAIVLFINGSHFFSIDQALFPKKMKQDSEQKEAA